MEGDSIELERQVGFKTRGTCDGVRPLMVPRPSWAEISAPETDTCVPVTLDPSVSITPATMESRFEKKYQPTPNTTSPSTTKVMRSSLFTPSLQKPVGRNHGSCCHGTP